VQAWRGRATPTIALETHVHLVDEEVGAPLELNAGGDKKATGGPETAESAGSTYMERIAA
jgi:hypothetical protein